MESRTTSKEADSPADWIVCWGTWSGRRPEDRERSQGNGVKPAGGCRLVFVLSDWTETGKAARRDAARCACACACAGDVLEMLVLGEQSNGVDRWRIAVTS
jgi:hypothetical protein